MTVYHCDGKMRDTYADIEPFQSLVFQLQSNDVCHMCFHGFGAVDSACRNNSYHLTIGTAQNPTCSLARNGVPEASGPMSCPPSATGNTPLSVSWANGHFIFSCGSTPGQNPILQFEDTQPLPCYRLGLSSDGDSTTFNIGNQCVPEVNPNFPGKSQCGPAFQPTNAALQPFGSVIIQLQSNETTEHCMYSLNQPDQKCAVAAYLVTITVSTVSLSRNGVVVVPPVALTVPPVVTNFNFYWFFWLEGVIQFGCGGTVGVGASLTFVDTAPLPVRSYAPKTDSNCGCSNVIIPSYCMAGAGRG